MTVPIPAPTYIEHPPWCLAVTACTFHAGGAHVSRARVLPADPGDEVMVVVDLIQMVDGGPQVRIMPRPAGDEISLTPAAARTLAHALRDLAYEAHRGER